MNILIEAEKLSDQIIFWRRQLHQIPEIGLVLPQTAAFVKKCLDNMSISYQTYENHSGIVAVLGKNTGKTIGIRADMDGLRIQEDSDFEYKSSNKNMHACGHDAHTAILLGTAALLKKHEAELAGQVKLIFQPAEEGPGGAKVMIEDGVMENPHIDAMLALHTERRCYSQSVNSGDILFKYGNSSAADDQVNITIIGKSGHGSAPDLCIDPIAAATLVINNIQYIISREIDPFKPCVITFGSIKGGDGAENIIPDTVEIHGTIRNQDLQVRDFVMKRIEEIVKYVTKATRTDYEIEFLNGYPPTKNDDKMVDAVIASAKKILPGETLKIITDESMGGEDAGFFYQKAPGCFFRLYTPAAYTDNIVHPAHSSRFVLDDSQLYRGTALFVQSSLDYLNN